MYRSRIHITKSTGERVPFSEQTLRSSLEKSGATEVQIDRVVGELDRFLYDGIPTNKIYRKAYEVLRKRSKGTAARYKLKKAIMELGPTGYAFERLVGAILEQQGYQTQVGILVQGQCIQHEIDVMAVRNGKRVMVECKFHNRPGVKCDVKVPLYIHSRFRDVAMSRQDPGEDRQNSDKDRRKPEYDRQNLRVDLREQEGWIVTNTRFTEDAVTYGTCAGLVMLGWDYPRNESLKQRIGMAGLHPVTCLGTLNNKEKKYLLEQGVVLCRNIDENMDVLRASGVSENRLAKVRSECDELMHDLEVPGD